MRKDKVLQRVKDELNYYNDELNYDYYYDDYYDDYSYESIVMYDYLPKEKQINKAGLLIDMESFYSKDKIRSLRIEAILAVI